MSQLTIAMDYIADQLIKKEHTEINETLTRTDAEKVSYMNATRTFQAHADYLQRTTAWKAS